MTVHAHFTGNKDFMWKKIRQNRNPWLVSPCEGITFLFRICISSIHHFVPIYTQCTRGPSRGHWKQPLLPTPSLLHSLGIHFCRRATYLLIALSLPGPPKYFRVFHPLYFWVPLVLLPIIGIVCSSETKDDSFMNRNQTDEWKGRLKLSKSETIIHNIRTVWLSTNYQSRVLCLRIHFNRS